MKKVTKKGLGKSSATGILMQLWRIGSRLILTPLIIAKVGLEGYGIWTILFSITGNLGMVNISIGVAYAKFTAEYDSRKDYRSLTSILSSGINIILFFALIAISTIWFFREPLLSLLNVPDSYLYEASKALIIVTAVTMIRFSFGCVFRVLEGLQRLDILNLLRISGSIIDFCFSIALLMLDYGLIGLAIGYATGELFALSLARYFCFKIEPRIRITPFRASWQGCAKILKLGGKFQLLAILSALFKEGSRILISIFLGVSMLAIYELARKLIMLGSSAGQAIIRPLLSAFSNIHYSENSNLRSRSLYLQSSRVLSSVTTLCFAFLATFAGDIVFLWTGETLPLTAWTIRVLAFGAFLQILTGVGTASLRARGKIRLEFTTAIITGVIIFGGVWPLAHFFNYKGLILAFVIGGIAGPVYFLFFFHVYEGIPNWDYITTVIIKPIFAIVPIIILCLVFIDYGDTIGAHFRPRVQTLFKLMFWAFLFTFISAITNWFFVLSTDERANIIQRIVVKRNLKKI